MDEGSLKFEVDSGLLFQLGEQLVARKSVALAELIKNAYDADATQVTVQMKNVTRLSGEIVVKDNGSGMTLPQIQKHWMRIATDEKKQVRVSPKFGRPYTGAKGIGRFAARRLANKLTLISIAVNDEAKERVVVEFDWRKNFHPGQTLTDIPVTYQVMTVDSAQPTGVTLHLEDIRDIWDEDDINELQRDLLSLISPFPNKLENDEADAKSGSEFSIALEAPEFVDYEGELREKFLEAAWGALIGQVDDDGRPHYKLNTRDPNNVTTFDPENEHYPTLNGARLQIRFFVYKSDHFSDFDFGVRDAQRMGRENGGVRIYLDGFRVFPYGDPGDDWLELDKVRSNRNRPVVSSEFKAIEKDNPDPRPWLLTPSNTQLFGAVEISQQGHPDIEINVSRERLVENEAFEQLRRFVNTGIYWMVTEYARVTHQERQRERDTRSPTVSQVIDQAIGKVNTSRDIPQNARREISLVLNEAKLRAELDETDRMTERSMLRVLSAAGTMVSVTNHQFQAIVSGILGVYNELEGMKQYVSPHLQNDYEKILIKILDWHEVAKSQVLQLEVLLGKDARERRKRHPLRNTVEKVVGSFSYYMKNYDITFCNNIPPNIKTPPMFLAELSTVIQHTLSNSLKAVRDLQNSRIEIKATKGEAGIYLYVSDSGPGIALNRREKVFTAFDTTSSPDPHLGVGTGLGLKVVRDVLETYGGHAQFIEPQEPWSTCIEMFFPSQKTSV